MPLYLGSEQLNIAFSDGLYNLHISESFSPIRLLSYDNYILQDSDGLYLIPKEDD